MSGFDDVFITQQAFHWVVLF